MVALLIIPKFFTSFDNSLFFSSTETAPNKQMLNYAKNRQITAIILIDSRDIIKKKEPI